MRNETKQTAVGWLIQKLINRQNGVFDGFPHLSVDEIYEQAKEMEKDQIIEGYGYGHNDGCKYMNNEKPEFIHAEQYHEQTYGGNK
jgi:hypothetical protein